MPSENGQSPSYYIALRTTPYTLPITIGVLFLIWGISELVPILTTYFGDIPKLFTTTVILAVGVSFLLSGICGTFSLVLGVANDLK